MRYLIGVDGGSQSTKVVIFDEYGRVVAQGKKDLRPMILSPEGFVEHPDDDLYDSFVAASREAMKNFPGKPEEIVGLGLCTIRCCRVLLDENGMLASPVQSWMDIRLSRPYEHTDPRVRYVTTTTGYMTGRLTGQFRDTAANCEYQWPLDKDTWQWHAEDEVIRQYGLKREMLFELQNPGDIAGYLLEEVAEETGIPAGIPVVATANDKAVEALGAGLLDQKTILVSLGTYITSMVPGDRHIKKAESFYTNLACIPYRYLYESGGIRRGMWTVSWLIDLLGSDPAEAARRAGLSVEDYLNREAAKVPVGSEGLMTVLDWLAPGDKPYKKGLMIGFSGRHNWRHMYRSVVEGIALTMKNHSDVMLKELGLAPESLMVSGGGSSGDLFMQVFADVYGLPARRTVVNGAASLGSAICAAVAAGIYPGFEEAVAAMVRVRDEFMPVPAHTEFYGKMNEVYREITLYTDEILKKAYPLFG